MKSGVLTQNGLKSCRSNDVGADEHTSANKLNCISVAIDSSYLAALCGLLGCLLALNIHNSDGLSFLLQKCDHNGLVVLGDDLSVGLVVILCLFPLDRNDFLHVLESGDVGLVDGGEVGLDLCGLGGDVDCDDGTGLGVDNFDGFYF